MTSILSFSIVARADGLDFDRSIPKTINNGWLCQSSVPYGAPCRMFWEDAKAFCGSEGKTLLTTRDFANYAQRNGAAGILESAYPNHSIFDAQVRAEIRRVSKNGYEPIYRMLDNEGKVGVDFYYNKSGYKPPVTSYPYIGSFEAWSWTSSPAWHKSHGDTFLQPERLVWYYAFHSFSGDIFRFIGLPGPGEYYAFVCQSQTSNE